MKGDVTLIIHPGITIFDITEPSTPRYCFVDFFGMESEQQVQLMSPLDISTWLRAYKHEDAFVNHAEIWERWQLVVWDILFLPPSRPFCAFYPPNKKMSLIHN